MAESGAQTEKRNTIDGSKGEEKCRKIEERILVLKRNKRPRKSLVTKVRHNLEKLCVTKGEIDVENIEKEIEGLCGVLDSCLTKLANMKLKLLYQRRWALSKPRYYRQ